jgi:hypothetical protein
MKQSHPTVTKTLIPTENMMMTLLLQVGAKCIFGWGQRTPGILVVSILSLEIPVDLGYSRCLI